MKTKTLLLVAISMLFGMQSQAQFWKKVTDRAAKAAEETVLNKVDEKTTRTTEKTMDTIFDSGNKTKKQKKIPEQQENAENTKEPIEKSSKRTAKSAKDFVAGSKVIYSDTFSNDAIGDFPVTWNTNASAEVVTFEREDTRWLQLSNVGQFTPDGVTDIPDNSTLEFDLYVPDNYSFYSSGIYVNLIEIAEKGKDFMQWSQFKNGKNGIRLWFHPTVAGGSKDTGRSGVYTYVDGAKILENNKTNDQFTINNGLVHVSIWRQKSRMRVYLNDKKVWDLPRAFDTPNYNSLTFSVGKGQVDSNFYVANLRLAVAGEDKRHALLETGKFETNEILFDVGKSTIRESSFSILDELGKLLEEHVDFDINIIGHTDDEGSASANKLLSKNRAKSVKEYLGDNFLIKGNRLQTEGQGASKPVASNDTDEGKRKNRRVEFIKI